MSEDEETWYVLASTTDGYESFTTLCASKEEVAEEVLNEMENGATRVSATTDDGLRRRV